MEHPSQIDRFEVIGSIGSDGYGAILKGRDPATGEEVRIRLVERPLKVGDAALQEMKRQIEAVRNLRREEIADVVACGALPDGRAFMVTVEGAGPTLAALLSGGGMDPAEVGRLMEPVMEALAKCHTYGICHGSLAPEKLAYVQGRDGAGRLSILDFGLFNLAISSASAAGQAAQDGDQGPATPYTAKEVTEPGGYVGPWTDVYAVGAVLYHMLAGQPPPMPTSLSSLASGVSVVRLRELRPELSTELDQVVAKAMEETRLLRHTSMDSFRQALVRSLHDKAADAAAAAAAHASHPSHERRNASHPRSYPTPAAQPAQARPDALINPAAKNALIISGITGVMVVGAVVAFMIMSTGYQKKPTGYQKKPPTHTAVHAEPTTAPSPTPQPQPSVAVPDKPVEPSQPSEPTGERPAAGDRAVGGVSSAVERGAILKAMRRYRTVFKYCYDRELRKNPKISGNLVLQISIDPTGRVTDAQVGSGTLMKEGRLVKCMTRVARRIHFPKLGRTLKVSYPLRFESRN